MIKDIENVRVVVREVLENNIVARDCDKTLWLEVMRCYRRLDLKFIRPGKRLTWAGFRKFMLEDGTPPFESITRARRKIQEEGEFLGKKRKARKSMRAILTSRKVDVPPGREGPST